MTIRKSHRSNTSHVKKKKSQVARQGEVAGRTSQVDKLFGEESPFSPHPDFHAFPAGNRFPSSSSDGVYLGRATCDLRPATSFF